MQTFLPFPDFKMCAQCLDRMRLGKQRLEVVWLLKTIKQYHETEKPNHPLVRMWCQYPVSLILYGIEICYEWTQRGYQDEQYKRIVEHIIWANRIQCIKINGNPWWLGNEQLHKSHRGRLVAKYPGWYRNILGWTDEPCEQYFWPC